MLALLLALQSAAAPCAVQAPEAGQPSLTDRAAPACRPPSLNWRTIATEEDRRRIRDWRETWLEAAAQAGAEGQSGLIAREGVLLDPDVALESPAPPPGAYRCRVLKVGSQHPGQVAAFTPYAERPCRIGLVDGRMTFAMLDGPQRPLGRLYTDNELRLVFLGTLQLGDEVRTYQYGVDPERDMIGLLQRIEARRWRLVLPRPAHQSLLDVIELRPR